MPYPGITDPGDIKRMDKCVTDVMGQGHDKSSAIAICHNSIMGGVSIAEATLQYVRAKGLALVPMTKGDMAYVHSLLGAQIGDAELLKFEGAVLAREGRNLNGDGLALDSLEELAATLPLMAIDDEHHDRRVVGFITNPRREGPTLLIDGLIYARRFPEIVAGILAGTKKLSVEAWAAEARCSECGQVFTSEKTYCACLQGRRTGKATRWLAGLKGIGAGTTDNPAEPVAGFDENRVTFLASLDESKTRCLDAGASTPPGTHMEEPQGEPAEEPMDENEKKELEATLADVRAQLAAKVAELEAATAKTADLESKLAASTTSHARTLDLLEAGFTRAEVESMKDELSTTPETVLQVLKATKVDALKNVSAAAASVAENKPKPANQQVLGGDGDKFDLSVYSDIFA